MARLNVEDDILRDPRFQALVRRMNGDLEKAIGRLVRFWWLAQKHWGRDKGLIPVIEFELGEFEFLLDCGLAEKRDDQVYAKGAKEHLDWYHQRIEAGRQGGIKSASKRLEKYGTSDPHVLGSKHEAPLHETGSDYEANEKQPRSNKKPLTPTLTPTLKEDFSYEKRGQPGSPRAPYQDFLTIWNSNRGTLAGVEVLSDSRKAKVRARWSEKPNPIYWEACVKKMAASSFCCEGKWATFDWLVKNDTNHVKVSEGKYDNRETASEGADLEKRKREMRELLIAAGEDPDAYG